MDDATATSRHKKNVIHDGEIVDVVLSGGKFTTEVYKTAFRIKGKVWESGSARVDILLNHTRDEVVEIKRKLGIKNDNKLVLYVPTFRKFGNEKVQCYNLDMMSVLNCLEQKYEGNWKMLVHLHPLEKRIVDTTGFEDKILDVTNYEDVQGLLIISDVLITDYSSIMFDFSYMKRPIFLYINDIKEYLEKERDLFFKPEELPFPLAETNEELHDNILDFDEPQYRKNVERFHDKCGVMEDGKASKTHNGKNTIKVNLIF